MDGLPPPGAVDYAACAWVLLGGLRGYAHGLSGELARLVSAIAGLVLGLRFYGPVGDWMPQHTRLEQGASRTLAFAATVLLVFLSMTLIRRLLQLILHVVVERRAERVGGVAAGLLRAAMVVCMAFLFMNLWPHPYLNRIFGEQSTIGAACIRAWPALRETFEAEDP